MRPESLILCLVAVSVRARSINEDNIRDRYIPAFGGGVFGSVFSRPEGGRGGVQFKSDVSKELSEQDSIEVRRAPDIHDQSGFNNNFNRDFFNRNGDGLESSRRFGSHSHEFEPIFKERGFSEPSTPNDPNIKDMETSIHSKRKEHRTNNDQPDRESEESKIENFDLETKVQDRSRGPGHKDVSHHRSTSYEGSYQHRSQSFGPELFNTHSFNARSIQDRNNPNVDNSFITGDSRVGAQGGQGFGSEQLGGTTDNRHKNNKIHNDGDVDRQRNKHKDEFEILSAGNRDKFETAFNNANKPITNEQNDRYEDNLKNVNIDQTLRSNFGNENASRIEGHTKRQRTGSNNSGTVNREDVNNNRNQSRRVRPKTQIVNNHKTHENDGVLAQDERPVMNSTDNETNQNVDDRNNKTDRDKEVEEDRWVWGVEANTNTTMEAANVTQHAISSTTPQTVTVDDRAAFDGSKCPTGKVKINNMCVDED